MPDPDAGLPNLCKRNSGAFVFYEHNLNQPKTDTLLLTISDITMQHHDKLMPKKTSKLFILAFVKGIHKWISSQRASNVESVLPFIDVTMN